MSISEKGNLQKSELIKKLEAISILHDKALAIKSKMNNFKPEDNYERKVKVPLFPGEYKKDEEREELENAVEHEDEDAIEQMGQEYDLCYAPKKPVEPAIKDFEFSGEGASKEKQKKYGCFSYVAAAVSGFFLLSLLLGTADGAVGAIVIIAVIAALVFAFFRYKIKTEKGACDKQKAEALAQYNLKKNQLWADHNERLKAYESEFNSYKLVRQKFLNEYADWRKIYVDSMNEEAQIEEKLEADRVAAVKKIEDEEYIPVLEDLGELNDLVTYEYLPALNIIIDLLKSNRADDLKEAINLYEDIVYRERQLQLQREKEEQRRYEEERRRQDEERRYQEEKRFREEQERQRQYEEQQRQRDEERRHREDMRLREDQERNRQREAKAQMQEERRKNDIAERNAKASKQKRCMYCAYQPSCGLKYTDAAYNCTGFKPR